MKTKYTAIALIIASSLIAGTSFAGDGHAQVKPVRAPAVSSGNILAAGETNAKLNELYPSLYAAKLAQVGATRDLVNAELAQVQRTGDLVAAGETSLNLNERYPDSYPAKQVQAGLTRVQVKAELAEALRTGDFIVAGEGPTAKCNELHPNMHSAV